MSNNSSHLDARTTGFSLAAVLAIIFNTLLVWAKESSPSLEATMKAALGHHWITHGVTVVLVFLILGFVLSKLPFAHRMNGAVPALLLFCATVLAGLGLVGFFLLE